MIGGAAAAFGLVLALIVTSALYAQADFARKQAEAALRESSERLRSILDNVPLGVMFLDPQGYLIECNPRLGAMSARQPGDLLEYRADP